MRSGNRPYLASIDHLRACAVLLVVFFHGNIVLSQVIGPPRPDNGWWYSLNPISTAVFEGHTGVTLFMVLSGFIFTTGTLGRQISWSRFMGNRLLRIYPMFLLVTMFAIAAKPGSFSFLGLVQTLVGLGNEPGAVSADNLTSGVAWAIAVEMQFYLVFPLLNRILSQFGMRVFLRLLAAIVVLRGLAWAVSPTRDAVNMLFYNIAGRIDHFMIGMIAAWLFVRYRDRFVGAWKLVAAVTLAIVMLWAFNQLHGTANATTAWRLLWVDVEACVWALVVLVYAATVRSAKPWSRLVARFGEASFSMYLLHIPVIDLLHRHQWWIKVPGFSAVDNATLTTLVIVVPVTTVLSFITFAGVEKPFLSLRMKYLSDPVDPVEAPPEVRPRSLATSGSAT
jgi:peptidoglycan/LPS O-acetylase OafA/YrhL